MPESYHTYDDDCRINHETILDNMDHYFLIHFTNWFFLSMVLRDAVWLHVWHIVDELLELSFQHILPHFRECWWDHIFHDVLLMNIPGVVIGTWFVKWMGWEEYDTLGRKGSNGFLTWKMWHCHRRFGAAIYAFILCSANFLTGFFIINAMWIPPTNALPVIRLGFWFVMGNMVFAEGWRDISTWGTPERRKVNPGGSN